MEKRHPNSAGPRIFIMLDMEGSSGIVLGKQTMPPEREYASGQRYLVADVNACIDACFAAGASHVVVRDAHYQGFNLVWDQMDERAEYVQGPSRQRMPQIETFDAMILLGYHAMAGTHEAVLDHTMSGLEWQNLWLNGVRSGEIAIEAGIAADHGVPTILVTGDDKCCAEAREFLPGVHTVQVKAALGRLSAQMRSQQEAHALLREGTQRAIKDLKNIKPKRISAPVTLRLELVHRNVPPQRSHVKVLGPRSYEVTGATVEEALKAL